jgi:hypothetical protein
LLSDGFMLWSQPIWVSMDPVFQIRWSTPCALKKEYSSAGDGEVGALLEVGVARL